MAKGLFQPIPLKYSGLYADDQQMDLQELGVSLQGLGKLSNSVVNFYLRGEIMDKRLYQVRVYGGPPEKGSIAYDIVALMAAGQLPLWAPILCDIADAYIPALFKAIISSKLKKPDQMENVVNRLLDIAQEHAEFAHEVHEGHMRDKAWLQKQIETLSEKNGSSLKEIVKPIGSTCRQLTFGDDGKPDQAVVGEPEAQALSSKDDLTVEDAKEYQGVFEGVDTTNGSCKIRIAGFDDVVPGKITDPILSNVMNPYTHSLDTKKPIRVTAKAVMKDGEVVRLFISDGRQE